MKPSIKTVALVPAAGCGRRLGIKARKPFVILRGVPLIAYTLKALNSCKSVNAIIVAAERLYIRRLENIVRRYSIGKVIAIVAGGETRYHSVRNCIRKAGSSFDIILIHDAARPFIDDKIIKDAVKAAARYGGCVVAIPESDTVKFTDGKGFVKRTLDRSRVYRAQTPQAFRSDIIKRVYLSGRHRGATDDASLVEAAGFKVKIVEGSYRNIKITTKEDIKIGEALLSRPGSGGSSANRKE